MFNEHLMEEYLKVKSFRDHKKKRIEQLRKRFFNFYAKNEE